jgi:hypothetical protein
MQSKAATVDQYIKELPSDRREAISAIRQVFLKNLNKGFEERMSYGMIGYCVPHSIYPAGYHCDPKQPLPFVAIASQKNAISVYLFCIYADSAEEDRFRKAWAATGKKLDMGKSCVRFKKLEDCALDVLADTLKRITVQTHIAQYEKSIPAVAGRSATTSASTPKPSVKNTSKAKSASRSVSKAKSSATKPNSKSKKKVAKR